MKGIIRIKHFYPQNVPPYKSRNERETRQILRMAKVIAMKRQHEDEISHPVQVFSLPQYQTPERRMDLLKKVWLLSRLLLP